MSKTSPAHSFAPEQVKSALLQLGEDLSLARVRRKESQRTWAARIGVSVPTLIRLERGDPTVGAGIYATALWMIGRSDALSQLASPASDLGALEMDIRAALKTRAVRKKASIEANLAKLDQQSSTTKVAKS